jgi:AcrR family transcriptional regulator
VSPPRGDRSIDRRQLILNAARQLFAHQPYDQVTTSEIARQASVAYGLIAHHFGNKRGLYLAVMDEIATEIASVHIKAPPDDASAAEQIRHALRSHITYIDSYGDSFVAFVRGNLGSDPQQRAAFDELRAQGMHRALHILGVGQPIPPLLRTALRGWVCAFDEMMIDRITHHDLDPEAIVRIAVANLAAILKTVATLDSTAAVPPAIIESLNGAP